MENNFLNEKISDEKIEKILSNIIKQKVKKDKINLLKEENVDTYISEDKYNIKIGISKATKEKEIASGDSSVQIKLKDGKYLMAISDGMGSGENAKKSSKTALNMLEKLLSSGFDKENSLKLINSTLSLNAKDDMYATLDVLVLDLYNGNLEFIKNGACPTFIKEGKETQIIKALSLPAGILDNIDLNIYDKDIDKNEIIVMCSDGVVDSNNEYKNKELWVKDFIDKIETTNPQKIADLLLLEAIDNNYGVAKDDMTIIVMKIEKN